MVDTKIITFPKLRALLTDFRSTHVSPLQDVFWVGCTIIVPPFRYIKVRAGLAVDRHLVMAYYSGFGELAFESGY